MLMAAVCPEIFVTVITQLEASADQAACKATYFESINLGSSDLLALHSQRRRQGRIDL